MSLLTWAEENLTALETCPSDEKQEAATQLEPEGAQKGSCPLGASAFKLCASLHPGAQVPLLIPRDPSHPLHQLPLKQLAPLVCLVGSPL